MTKTVIIGAGGQLGRELSMIYPDAIKYYHSGNGNCNIDLSDSIQIYCQLKKIKPDVIINAAALANVDTCEKNRRLAYSINAEPLKILSSISRELGALLIHVSTDYVFDGETGNYNETSLPNPINYYGLSKLVGDIYALGYTNSIVVRTSGVYGYNNNFPLFVLNNLRNNYPVSSIKGFYSPIHAKLLAEGIRVIADTDFRGLINIAGERTSRYNFAIEIAKKFQLSQELIKENDSLLSLNARRPFDSSLDCSLAKQIIKIDFSSLTANIKAFEQRLAT